jgi:hypothetical protein
MFISATGSSATGSAVGSTGAEVAVTAGASGAGVSDAGQAARIKVIASNRGNITKRFIMKLLLQKT